MQKLGAVLLGVLHAGASVLVALWGALVAVLHCYNRECSGGDWTVSREAWQWDVLLVLALAGGLIGLITAVVALSTPRLVVPAVGLGVQTAVVLVVGVSLRAGAGMSQAAFLLCLLLVLASGFALLYATASRQRAGMRPA